MIFGRLYYDLQATDWKHFFSKNGVGKIKSMRRRWSEHPNHPFCEFVISGEISGGYRSPNGKGLFCAYNNDEGWVESGMDLVSFRNRIEEACESHFASFASPDCRCRVGLHWRCGVHRKWRG